MAIQILETSRLILREFNLDDAPFIVKLLNSDGWLKYIGDRNAKDEDSARRYLIEGPMTSYSKNGFGLWAVQRKDDRVLIGMCGLLKRDSLEGVDLGFALLPEFSRQQYAREIASATMDFARYTIELPELLAITLPDNVSSIKLLVNLGFSFIRTQMQGNDRVLVFKSSTIQHRIPDVESLVKKFYEAFVNKNATPNVDGIGDLFIPTGMIIKNVQGTTEAFSVDTFLQSRQQLLTDGTMTDFQESEISSRCEFFGNIGHRVSLYIKSGRLNGKPFTTFGVKSMQFLNTPSGWKISSVAWDDENT